MRRWVKIAAESDGEMYPFDVSGATFGVSVSVVHGIMDPYRRTPVRYQASER